MGRRSGCRGAPRVPLDPALLVPCPQARVLWHPSCPSVPSSLFLPLHVSAPLPPELMLIDLPARWFLCVPPRVTFGDIGVGEGQGLGTRPFRSFWGSQVVAAESPPLPSYRCHRCVDVGSPESRPWDDVLGAGLLFGRSFQEARVRLQEGRQGREKSQHEPAAGAPSPCGPSDTAAQ